MTWPSNHLKLATGTMFTLFFAGRDFAPDLEVGGVNVQDFLQGHYIAAMAKVAEKLGGEPNVVGFDSLNEPNMGMAGWQDLSRGSNFMKQGPSPSWFQSFQLGEGIPQVVPYYNPALVPQVTPPLLRHGHAPCVGFNSCELLWEAANSFPARRSRGLLRA